MDCLGAHRFDLEFVFVYIQVFMFMRFQPYLHGTQGKGYGVRLIFGVQVVHACTMCSEEAACTGAELLGIGAQEEVEILEAEEPVVPAGVASFQVQPLAPFLMPLEELVDRQGVQQAPHRSRLGPVPLWQPRGGPVGSLRGTAALLAVGVREGSPAEGRALALACRRHKLPAASDQL